MVQPQLQTNCHTLQAQWRWVILPNATACAQVPVQPRQ